jgi:hypothetical protein
MAEEDDKWERLEARLARIESKQDRLVPMTPGQAARAAADAMRRGYAATEAARQGDGGGDDQ